MSDLSEVEKPDEEWNAMQSFAGYKGSYDPTDCYVAGWIARGSLTELEHSVVNRAVMLAANWAASGSHGQHPFEMGYGESMNELAKAVDALLEARKK